MAAKPVALRPVQTRKVEREGKVVPTKTLSESSSAPSSGEEFVPDVIARRVRREGRASQVVKKALQGFGLVEAEEVVRKAKSRRTKSEQGPMISYTQEECEVRKGNGVAGVMY